VCGGEIYVLEYAMDPHINNSLGATLGPALLASVATQTLFIMWFAFTPSIGLYVLLLVPAAFEGATIGIVLWRFGPHLSARLAAVVGMVVTVPTFLATVLLVQPPGPPQFFRDLVLLTLPSVSIAALLTGLLSVITWAFRRANRHQTTGSTD
jgi:hypothetical protein